MYRQESGIITHAFLAIALLLSAAPFALAGSPICPLLGLDKAVHPEPPPPLLLRADSGSAASASELIDGRFPVEIPAGGKIANRPDELAFLRTTTDPRDEGRWVYLLARRAGDPTIHLVYGRANPETAPGAIPQLLSHRSLICELSGMADPWDAVESGKIEVLGAGEFEVGLGQPNRIRLDNKSGGTRPSVEHLLFSAREMSGRFGMPIDQLVNLAPSSGTEAPPEVTAGAGKHFEDAETAALHSLFQGDPILPWLARLRADLRQVLPTARSVVDFDSETVSQWVGEALAARRGPPPKGLGEPPYGGLKLFIRFLATEDTVGALTAGLRNGLDPDVAGRFIAKVVAERTRGSAPRGSPKAKAIARLGALPASGRGELRAVYVDNFVKIARQGLSSPELLDRLDRAIQELRAEAEPGSTDRARLDFLQTLRPTIAEVLRDPAKWSGSWDMRGIIDRLPPRAAAILARIARGLPITDHPDYQPAGVSAQSRVRAPTPAIRAPAHAVPEPPAPAPAHVAPFDSETYLRMRAEVVAADGEWRPIIQKLYIVQGTTAGAESAEALRLAQMVTAFQIAEKTTPKELLEKAAIAVQRAGYPDLATAEARLRVFLEKAGRF